MKYETMIKMLMYLLQKRKITARELAEKYDVSVRSIYRYVEELIISGVPIDIERGRYGGLTIADTYRLPTGYFTRDEYTATINALDAMASQISDENVIAAREKLESRQKYERGEMSICGNIIVDGGTWGDGKKFTEKMQVCEQAVNECRSLVIEYISREGKMSRRTIDPHVLIYKQNIWYVYAFCHSKRGFRTFKVGRIRYAAFTDKTFEKKKFTRDDIDLNFYYNVEELVDVTFRIEKNSLPDAEEWLGIDIIEPCGDAFEAHASLPDDDMLVNKILSYGGAVTVTAPKELKEKVAYTAKKIAEQYK
ncbi:MAG: YafY family transcriptional regulator [Clostridiales bacterium]|nr:YafY family transcriptional regulator [Clostridiales bacterium]